MSVFNLFSDINMTNSKSTFQAVRCDKNLNPYFSNRVRTLPIKNLKEIVYFVRKLFPSSKWGVRW